MNYQAIATHLNVELNRIKSVDTWANCLFVVVKGLGARFVSKKVVEMEEKIECLHGGKSLFIPKKPGVYEVEAPHVAWGGKLFIAYNGEKAMIVGYGNPPKTFDHAAFDWRTGFQVSNNVVKVGR